MGKAATAFYILLFIVIVVIIMWLINAVTGIFTGLFSWIGSFTWEPLGQLAETFFTGIYNYLDGIGKALGGTGETIAEQIGTGIINTTNWFVEGIYNIFTDLGRVFGGG